MKRLLPLFLGCTLILAACSDSESSEGWKLINREIEPTLQPGDAQYFSSSVGTGVRFVVSSETGDQGLCDELPTLSDADISSGFDSVEFGLQWPQRGCSDAGNVAFTVVFEEELPTDGMTIRFPVTPETTCEGVLITPAEDPQNSAPVTCQL